MDFNDPKEFNDPQLFDDPKLFDDLHLFYDQLEVWTLIIQKSTVIPSSPMVLCFIYIFAIPETHPNTDIFFFSLHHLLHSITLIEKICAPIIHNPSHEAPPAAQHTWFSYQHVGLSTGHWDHSTFILFYKTYPVLQKYTKSFLPSMDWYSKLCIRTVLNWICCSCVESRWWVVCKSTVCG